MVCVNPSTRLIENTNDLMTLMYLVWRTLGCAKKSLKGAGIIDKEASSGAARMIGLYWFVWKTEVRK